MAAEDVCETVLEPTLLKYNEAAEYLNVSSSTLYAMVSNGRVPVVRMGSGPKGKGITRFRHEDLEAFVAANAS